MSEQPNKNPGGPPRPSFWFVLLSWLPACVLLALIAFLFHQPAPAPMRRLWIPVTVETNGNVTVLGETRQLQFWTPSARTKDYLRKFKGEVADIEKWQVLASDEAVEKFGLTLHSNKDVLGYRRSEDWGQGVSGFKPGWWWTMTVLTNYSASDLAKSYHEYWKSPQPVRVEVVDNRGSP